MFTEEQITAAFNQAKKNENKRAWISYHKFSSTQIQPILVGLYRVSHDTPSTNIEFYLQKHTLVELFVCLADALQVSMTSMKLTESERDKLKMSLNQVDAKHTGRVEKMIQQVEKCFVGNNSALFHEITAYLIGNRENADFVDGYLQVSLEIGKVEEKPFQEGDKNGQNNYAADVTTHTVGDQKGPVRKYDVPVELVEADHSEITSQSIAFRERYFLNRLSRRYEHSVGLQMSTLVSQRRDAFLTALFHVLHIDSSGKILSTSYRDHMVDISCLYFVRMLFGYDKSDYTASVFFLHAALLAVKVVESIGKEKTPGEEIISELIQYEAQAKKIKIYYEEEFGQGTSEDIKSDTVEESRNAIRSFQYYDSLARARKNLVCLMIHALFANWREYVISIRTNAVISQLRKGAVNFSNFEEAFDYLMSAEPGNETRFEKFPIGVKSYVPVKNILQYAYKEMKVNPKLETDTSSVPTATVCQRLKESLLQFERVYDVTNYLCDLRTLIHPHGEETYWNQ